VSLEVQVLIAVVLIDAFVIGGSVAMDWTPLTNERQRKRAYRMNPVLWLFGVFLAIFSGWQLYEWYAHGELLYASRREPTTWVSLPAQPQFFTFLAVMYSCCFLMTSAGSIALLAKFLGLWRMTDDSN